ncbi:large ribosomal subunit protein uL4c-like [Phragmites australis]|uniref:large ribosomal subunit protein uL4c-like n=1 Tax=Phragmites australis TaxID=29695 RepID=UPI002D78B972|nr:large ribosomal subunit protein uL4c-like [Phragmites australis]
MFFAMVFNDNVHLNGRNIGSLKMLTPRTLNLYAFVLEEFDEAFAAAPKTGEFVSALQRWGLDPKQKAMFFATVFDDNVPLSPRTLNLYDILDSRKLLFTPAAIDYLNSRYGATVFDEYENDTDGEVDGE